MTDSIVLAKAKIEEIKPKIERLQKELSLWEQILELDEPIRKTVIPFIAKEVKEVKSPNEIGLKKHIIGILKKNADKFLGTREIIQELKPLYPAKTEDQLKSRVSPILSENKVTEKKPNGLFIAQASTNRKAGYEWSLSEKGKAA